MKHLRPGMVVLPVTMYLLAIVGCASTQSGVRTSNCTLPARDSVFLVGGPVYRGCGVTVAAKRVAVGMHPDFHQADPRTGCYSADLEFVVDTLGHPELPTARVVRTNSRDWADAVVATLGQWRYEPATLNGAAVRQIVVSHEAVQAVVRVVEVFVPRGGGVPVTPPPSTPAPTC